MSGSNLNPLQALPPLRPRPVLHGPVQDQVGAPVSGVPGDRRQRRRLGEGRSLFSHGTKWEEKEEGPKKREEEEEVVHLKTEALQSQKIKAHLSFGLESQK